VALSSVSPVVTSSAVIVTFALALAAGLVLARWWAVAVLAVATTLGGLVGAWAIVQVCPSGSFKGLSGMATIPVVFGFFASLDLLPLIAVLPAGIGLVQAQPGDAASLLPGILYVVVLTLTCLLAGWLLRSWEGHVAAAVVYVGVAALILLALSGGSLGNIVGFLLYIAVPAVVMSAIGTAIGMSRAPEAGHPPEQARLAA
jgi:hypothetical protein